MRHLEPKRLRYGSKVLRATLVVVSFKFPLMACAPPLGHGFARDRKGRVRDGGGDADGG